MDVTPPTLDLTDHAPARAGAVPFGLALDQRVLVAARDCVAVNGLRDTTVDDIATAAGCGRASIYRLFPGGRRGVLRAMVDAEVDGLLGLLAADADAAPDLATAVAGAVHTAATLLAAHPALQRLLAEEPGAVLPYISFDGAAPLVRPRPAGRGRGGVGRPPRAVPPAPAERPARPHRPGQRPPPRRPLPRPRPRHARPHLTAVLPDRSPPQETPLP
jgi:AcrR family transcriptional regulator